MQRAHIQGEENAIKINLELYEIIGAVCKKKSASPYEERLESGWVK